VKRAELQQQQRSLDDRILDGTTVSGGNPTDTSTGESKEAINNALEIPAQTGIAMKQPSVEMCGEKESQSRTSFLDLPGLVRSIQRAEGNIDCFRLKQDCDQFDCSWRSYCLGG
jgi:hypothetical protein